MKARAAAIAAVLVLGTLAGTAGAAENGLQLRPTGGTTFPERAYVLTLPTDAALGPSAIGVRENGELVEDASLVPAEAASEGQFGVVLAIDASNSMRGAAITAAVDAARAFAQHRQPNQAMAIVTFNSEAKVLLPFTTDREAIDAALANAPQLAEGTRMYDGVAVAESLLKKAKVAVRSVVVLSDGADTGSAHALGAVSSEARKSGVRIFSVGLRSGAFDPQALQQLARGGAGTYSEAETPADLEPIFNELGAKLASEYLIRYESQADPSSKIVVSVTVAGYPGAVTAGYTTPGLTRRGEGPFTRSFAERYVRSSLGMLATALVVSLLAATILLLALRPRRRDVRRRLAEFVSLAESEEKRRAAANRKDMLYDRAEQSFQGTRWWATFKEELEVARITIPPAQLVVWTAIGTLVAVYLLALIVGTLAGVLGLFVPVAVRSVIRSRLERQRQLFAEQLPDNLQVLASAMRAGHSLVGALSVVVDDAPEPSRAEFKRLVADEQLGVPLEDSFQLIAHRMDSRDVKQLALAAALQQETGGNTAEVLDRVADTVRERFELRRLVRTLTAQGRLSRWVLTALPLFLLMAISFINPGYISPLYNHGAGRIVLVVAALMVTCGSLVIRKLIDIKV